MGTMEVEVTRAGQSGVLREVVSIRIDIASPRESVYARHGSHRELNHWAAPLPVSVPGVQRCR